jgi:hypothetical protein
MRRKFALCFCWQIHEIILSKGTQRKYGSKKVNVNKIQKRWLGDLSAT